jgi:hypothetical protein
MVGALLREAGETLGVDLAGAVSGRRSNGHGEVQR